MVLRGKSNFRFALVGVMAVIVSACSIPAGGGGSVSASQTLSLLSPANNLFTNSTTVVLDWSGVAGVTSYRAHLGTSSSFTAASQVYSGTASEATLHGLVDNTYYWWAESRDAGTGETGSYTGPRIFTVDTVAPSLKINKAPPPVQVNASSVTYTFSASGYTTLRCRLYLSDQTPPAYQSCSSPFTQSIGYGSYTFEVQAIDAAGNIRTRTDTFENQDSG